MLASVATLPSELASIFMKRWMSCSSAQARGEPSALSRHLGQGVQFEVWDFPGHVDTASAAVKPEVTFGGCCALVWVIDAQDDHNEAIQRLASTIVTAHRVNPSIVFEVFVHKVDSLSDDQRIECQREIQNQLNEELATARVSGAKPGA